MSASPEDIAQKELVSLKINGKTYFGNLGDTILDVTKRNNIQVPHLCFKEGMRPDGNCRVCMVEIEGELIEQVEVTSVTASTNDEESEPTG